MHRVSTVLVFAMVGLLLAHGCATTDPYGLGHGSGQLPAWVDNPQAGLKGATIAGVGVDNDADVDVESAKQAAQIMATDQLAKQLEIKIVSMFQDRVTFKTKNGQSQLSEQINSSIKQLVVKKMVGVRYQDYVYLNASGKSDRINPKVIYVRAILDADSISLAEDLKDIEKKAAGDLFMDSNTDG